MQQSQAFLIGAVDVIEDEDQQAVCRNFSYPGDDRIIDRSSIANVGCLQAGLRLAQDLTQ